MSCKLETFLYTFILDFQGGTYISQVRAKDEKEAMHIWATNLEIESIPRFGHRMKTELIVDMEETTLTASSLVHHWCFGILPCGRFGQVNIIKTVEQL